MKLRLFILLALAAVVVLAGHTYREQTIADAAGIDYGDITRIAFRNGTTGELTEITDPEKIQELAQYLDGFRLRRSLDQTGRVGYLWYADFRSQSRDLVRITFTDTLNIDGTYYRFTGSPLDLNYITRFVTAAN
jgi:hypothetical protein